ncbi:MAG TPA: LmeA family phospholipid-binding protein [Jatrophihabitans sp.]
MPDASFGDSREHDRLRPQAHRADVRAGVPPPGEPTVQRSVAGAAPDALTVVTHGEAGPADRTILTPDRAWTVGRSPDADVVVLDSMVSRRHLLLENTGGDWVIRDVSANGSWCDGHRIAGDGMPVPPGRQMRVTLGDRTGPVLAISRPGIEPAAASTVPVVGQQQLPPPATKRRRRLRRTTIVLFVVLALLAIADRLAAHIASSQAVSQIVQQSQGLTSRPTVTFGGFPFLTQVAFGRYSDIHVGISGITATNAPRIEQIDAHLHGAHIPLSTVIDNKLAKIPVDHVTAAVTLRYADLNAFLAHQPGDIKLAGRDGAVEVTGTMNESGQTVTVRGSAKFGVEDDGVVITPTSLRVAGGGLPGGLGDLLGSVASAFPPIPVSLPDLPFNLRLTSVQSNATGLVVGGAADSVVLDTGQN